MCTLDKSYEGTTAFPKVVINPTEMEPEEYTFYESLLDTLRNSIDVNDLAVEQRFSDYRTVVYGDWSNDFLRYHFGEDGFWVSVRVYPGIIEDYEFSPLFYAQANKRSLHWKSSLEAGQISELKDVMLRSCLAFFGSKDLERNSRPTAASTKSRLRMQMESLVNQKTELASFLGEDYRLLSDRDSILAGASHHPASDKLVNGSTLVCEHEEDNPYDSEAVGVYDGNHVLVGYLPKEGNAKQLALGEIKQGNTVKGIVIDDGTDGGTRRKRKSIHIALLV